MVTRKWAVAGAVAVAGLATVSIYALLHRDKPVSHAASDEMTWSQATLPAAASSEDGNDSASSTDSSALQETYSPTGYANAWTDKSENGFVLLEAPNFDKALTGSIKGDQAGLGNLQNYLDSALGDEPILRRLAGRLLEGLSTSNIRHDYTAMAAASQRVAEGVARAMASAYRVHYGSTSDFNPEKTAMGWDFGPSSNKLPKHFSRVAPNSKEITGTKVAAFDLKSGSAPFRDGLTGVTSFKTPLTDGVYRVLVVSGPLADGSLPADPFGHLSTGGHQLRMVDATRNMPDAEVRFSSAGINYYVPTFAMAASVPGLAPINGDNGRLVKLDGGQGKGKPGQGELLVTRAKVENGDMTLSFAPKPGSETYIVALMVQNSDYSAFEKDIQDQIGALLSSIETAAGSDSRGSNHPGHASPFQTAFNSPQNGHPRTRGGSSSGGFGSGGGYGSGGYGSGGAGSSGSSSGSSSSSSSSSGGNGGDSGTPSSTSSSSSSGGNGGDNGTPSSTSSSSSSGGNGGDNGTPSSTSSSSSSGGNGGDNGTPSSTSSSSSSGGNGGDNGTPSSTSSSSSSGGNGGDNGTPSSTSSSSSSGGNGGDNGTPSSTSSSSSSGGNGGDNGTPSSTSSSSSSGGPGNDLGSSTGSSSGATSSSGGPKPQDALQADAGHDLVGNLGESFFLNGCNSAFNDQTLCDFTAEYLADNFNITWYYDGHEIASGITATLDTSTSPWFATVGDYILSLEIIFTGGDLQGLASTDFTQLSLNQNATIPVPGVLGLFGLGLLGLGYRRRL